MKIYVSNLDFSVQNEDLHEAFSAYGNVTSANIINDRETGRSRGFGFVEMENKAEAEAAISNLNETSLNGRNIRAAEAQDKPKSSNGGGGFRGGNGGGGGYSRNNKW
ncbi:RNA recognition motif. (a.k.a. RRM, RBD, or RNP domain) [Filimonas lacunae]|uniref:RNA recognition motif. (A.k.a. RRM, RBD, or RNP domain) n=1 Tax=Filimonas lacunae TaxID=477680 RepID=A0A173MDM1_9BACT|nr:RNA-binding protein [Filimonas lacunae]BAV05528.1 RNA-binding region RNP-1 [Filimonas lacunae]SIT20546.1 RNA recognition motif. (a.k.a. RRM, RBD, or RNP domain) [Filimonas lacunae]